MIRSYINGETPSTSKPAPKPESSKPLPKPTRYKSPMGDLRLTQESGLFLTEGSSF